MSPVEQGSPPGVAPAYELIDTLPLLLWTALPDGMVDSCNRQWCDYTGLSRQESLGHGWRRALHPEDMASTLAAVTHAFGTGAAYEIEQRLRRADGEYRWFLVRGTPVKDATGRVTHWHGANVDITEFKLAEARLRASAERHKTILQTSMDGFWMLDAHGHVQEVNDTYCRMSGYTAGELAKMTVADLEVIESAQEIHDHLARVKLHGHDRFETRHRRKDGTIFDVEVSVQFQPADGGYAAAFLEDITERKRAEAEKTRLQAELHQAQKMESVGRLAGGIAHDFNNMLGVILGRASMALEQVGPNHSLYSDLSEILTAARRSADLTRQLLAFARKQAVSPVTMDLNAVLSGMIRMLQRLLGEDIELVWRPGTELWPIRADSSQLDQVVANLCVNARDAMPGAGTLTVTTANVSFDAAFCADHPIASPGDFVRLTVSDTGIGMDTDTLAHLFEPFFTRKAVGKGTGLGLATAYGIIQQHGGFIDVDSKPNHGTTFGIHLPRHAGSGGAATTTATPAAPVGGRETILVVEDEPAILKVVTRMLQLQGYRVLPAGSPAEALQLAADGAVAIDLLVTDVVMPEMNGRDLANQLLAARPGLKRLFMSGYTANVIAERGVLAEGARFIQKPFTRDTLGDSVRQALDH